MEKKVGVFKVGVFTELVLLALFFVSIQVKADSDESSWNKATATFYGGSDASGTMGGACGYGDLYYNGYGSHTTALSTTLFNDGAACGECYKIMCDSSTGNRYCISGASVIVTATNFCPPNYALSNKNGGWCNQPNQHFDMSQPAWETIGVRQGGIVPVLYQRISCSKRGGVRFTINGHDYFELVLVTNVGGRGSIKSMSIKGSNTGWMPMQRNWGGNWQSNAHLNHQSISFTVTITDDQTLTFPDIARNWDFGKTYTSSQQFN